MKTCPTLPGSASPLAHGSAVGIPAPGRRSRNREHGARKRPSRRAAKSRPIPAASAPATLTRNSVGDRSPARRTPLPARRPHTLLAINIASRRVVSYAMTDHLRTELIAEALPNAVHDPEPGMIFHADRCLGLGENIVRTLVPFQPIPARPRRSRCIPADQRRRGKRTACQHQRRPGRLPHNLPVVGSSPTRPTAPDLRRNPSGILWLRR
jgi:hypothetical protein